MRKFTSAAAAVAVLLAPASVAAAAEKCSPQSAAGVHVLRTTAPSVCVLEVNSQGRITESRCYDPTFEADLGTLEGTLSVAPSCRLTGTVTQNLREQRRVEFVIQARGALVNGLLEVQGTARNSTEKLKIEAARQW
jgi:uncharacterized low-complexity protein